MFTKVIRDSQNKPFATFPTENEEQTRFVMGRFAEFLSNDVQSNNAPILQKIGVVGRPGAGKTVCAESLIESLGEQEIYEYNQHSSHETHRQSLRYCDSVGWVRHYDELLKGCKGGLKAAANDAFWDLHGYGLDVVEHPYIGDDFNFIFHLAREDDEQSRVEIALYVDKRYDDNKALSAFAKSVTRELLDMDHQAHVPAFELA